MGHAAPQQFANGFLACGKFNELAIPARQGTASRMPRWAIPYLPVASVCFREAPLPMVW